MEKKTAKVSYMFQFYKLLLKKSMTSTFFGFRRLRLSDTNWPAFFATCMRQGSRPLFSFHQASGSDDREITGSSKYLRTSITASVDVVL